MRKAFTDFDSDLKTSPQVSAQSAFKGAPLLAVSRLNKHLLVPASNSKQHLFG